MLIKKYLFVIFLFPTISLYSQNIDIYILKDININRNRNLDYSFRGITNSAIFSNILKYTVNRPRPFITYPFLEKVTSGGSLSFPSGHTCDAFTLATSVSIACPKWYVITPSYGWAGSKAYSRMDLGVQYPSDVLAGAIIGVGSAYLC